MTKSCDNCYCRMFCAARRDIDKWLEQYRFIFDAGFSQGIKTVMAFRCGYYTSEVLGEIVEEENN